MIPLDRFYGLYLFMELGFLSLLCMQEFDILIATSMEHDFHHLLIY